MTLWLHSTLRYLVFLAGLGVLGSAAHGLATRRGYDRTMHRLGSGFAMVLHLEILLGVGTLFTGRFSPALTGHVFMMVFAAATAQIVPSVMRRREPEERSFAPYLISTVVALTLVVGGILGLGRPVLGGVFG